VRSARLELEVPLADRVLSFCPRGGDALEVDDDVAVIRPGLAVLQDADLALDGAELGRAAGLGRDEGEHGDDDDRECGSRHGNLVSQ
jgi:hypothetical protein